MNAYEKKTTNFQNLLQQLSLIEETQHGMTYKQLLLYHILPTEIYIRILYI